MTMKIFFTISVSIFTLLLTFIFITGSISKHNRLSKEVRQKEEQLIAMKMTLDAAHTQIEQLQQENESLKGNTAEEDSEEENTSKTPTSPPIPKTPTPSKTTLTKTLVAQHSSPSDCWIIVADKVYSVAGYISMHPGGRTAITSQCGKDATNAFTSRGGTGKHSSSAWSLLNTFLVGTLGDTL